MLCPSDGYEDGYDFVKVEGSRLRRRNASLELNLSNPFEKSPLDFFFCQTMMLGLPLQAD